jgi:hypothetical protein
MTDNILILDDKMLQPVDVMGALLVKTLILHKERGMQGAIRQLDFARHFNEKIRAWLMKPIVETEPSEKLPEPSEYVDYRM